MDGLQMLGRFSLLWFVSGVQRMPKECQGMWTLR